MNKISDDYKIILNDLKVCYGETTALDHVSGQFVRGSLTSIVGPNGGGKTTLVKIINNLLKPTKGSLTMQGCVASDIAYMPQKVQVDTTFPLTVQELAGMGLMQTIGAHKKYSASHLDLIQEALEAVGLEHKSRDLIGTLSGGQLQRLLFARLILQAQPIVILDEPFASIDQTTRILLLKLIQKWHEEKKTIIVVMHDLDLVKSHFPETLLLARNMIAWGKTDTVLQDENLSAAFKQLLDMG